MPQTYKSFINNIVDNETTPLLEEDQIKNDECVICLDTMNTDNSKTLNCGHNFHTTCIESWNSIQITCPICRAISANTFYEFLIPNLLCILFKRKVTIVCNKTNIDITINYLFSIKKYSLPYTKIQSISATEHYLLLHLKNKNMMIKLTPLNVSALYNILYTILHNYGNNVISDPPF